MPMRGAKTAIDIAAERLRTIVLEAEEGALIGSEEALIAQLGCSRSTVRQVARLLEREGLLRVKRGINGGYFGGRPDSGTIEATVSAYLQTLDLDARDVMVIATTLWVEAVRKAAGAAPAELQSGLAALRRRIKALKDDATFEEVRELELKSQAEIFRLAGSNYIKLIFDINVAFAGRKFAAPLVDNQSAAHVQFVRDWREGKLVELGTVASGNAELAVLAAHYCREIWQGRLQRRFAALAEAKPV
jgi:GntR family transcriptional regulator, transcriptional repressor for pyruvate dehydrogenase complex